MWRSSRGNDNAVMAERQKPTSTHVSSSQCMAISLKFLRYMGLWPVAGDTIYWAYTLIIYFNCLILVLLHIMPMFYSEVDGLVVIKNWANVLTLFPLAVTATSIIRNKDSYDQIITGMRLTFHCEGLTANEDNIRFVRKIVAEEKYAITVYLLAVEVTANSYLLIPLVRILFSEPDEDPTVHLPFKMQQLFNRWELDYMLQFVTVSVYGLTMVSLDAFSFAIVKYAANQFEVLNMLLCGVGFPGASPPARGKGGKCAKHRASSGTRNISHNRAADVYGESEEDSSSQWEELLIDLTQLHQDILFNVQTLANHLSPLMFSHYLMSSINVCLVAYEIAMIDETHQIVATFSHLMVLLVRIFLLSYFSSNIMHQSSNVGLMAYSCNWFPFSKNFKRTLIMMMSRAQKPVVMRTGWFGILSLETFAKLMQAAYTYFTLLKKTNIS